jgi:hypothetical protein
MLKHHAGIEYPDDHECFLCSKYHVLSVLRGNLYENGQCSVHIPGKKLKCAEIADCIISQLPEAVIKECGDIRIADMLKMNLNDTYAYRLKLNENESSFHWGDVPSEVCQSLWSHYLIHSGKVTDLTEFNRPGKPKLSISECAALYTQLMDIDVDKPLVDLPRMVSHAITQSDQKPLRNALEQAIKTRDCSLGDWLELTCAYHQDRYIDETKVYWQLNMDSVGFKSSQQRLSGISEIIWLLLVLLPLAHVGYEYEVTQDFVDGYVLHQCGFQNQTRQYFALNNTNANFVLGELCPPAKHVFVDQEYFQSTEFHLMRLLAGFVGSYLTPIVLAFEVRSYNEPVLPAKTIAFIWPLLVNFIMDMRIQLVEERTIVAGIPSDISIGYVWIVIWVTAAVSICMSFFLIWRSRLPQLKAFISELHHGLLYSIWSANGHRRGGWLYFSTYSGIAIIVCSLNLVFIFGVSMGLSIATFGVVLVVSLIVSTFPELYTFESIFNSSRNAANRHTFVASVIVGLMMALMISATWRLRQWSEAADEAESKRQAEALEKAENPTSIKVSTDRFSINGEHAIMLPRY